MGIAERKNRQKQALRERILDAARRIVMREGFAALSMRKIADAIEYSPATLYLHFESRDEIARALCEEGYAQLLATFAPLAGMVDPAERLKAIGRAYVAFGVAHPQTYRLIFMEDPSYTGAALSGASAVQTAAQADADIDASIPADDDPGEAALQIMLSALAELQAAGRLSASTDIGVWAEAFWATLHGIVALNLTCPVFPSAPLDTVLGLTLDVWLGASDPAQSALAEVDAAGMTAAGAGTKASVANAGVAKASVANPSAQIATPPADPATQPAKPAPKPRAKPKSTGA
ncbi:TetR/AcrR family transcriptional regulator [Paraburkholderia sp. D15]|uniref:TetR/AcrR family transcriptional regulator n=1 Tax=Paraburkholderia sp. D15 TaxID=2880218 RepID=UPI00247A918D|nr:TetR/AcrR family transcriptional regulator [Paraburkholderia sp. D15]WGS48345.1 TetR/AcrR family transcriptional regulator [Paraburkholderia sp. D15]